MNYDHFRGYSVKDREPVAIYEYSGPSSMAPSMGKRDRDKWTITINKAVLKVRIATLLDMGETAVKDKKVLANMPVVVMRQ